MRSHEMEPIPRSSMTTLGYSNAPPQVRLYPCGGKPHCWGYTAVVWLTLQYCGGTLTLQLPVATEIAGLTLRVGAFAEFPACWTRNVDRSTVPRIGNPPPAAWGHGPT